MVYLGFRVLTEEIPVLAPLPSSFPIAKNLEEALKLAAANFVPHDGFNHMRYSPNYWREVFMRVYGREPSGNRDVAWDPLFKEGFPAFRDLKLEP